MHTYIYTPMHIYISCPSNNYLCRLLYHSHSLSRICYRCPCHSLPLVLLTTLLLSSSVFPSSPLLFLASFCLPCFLAHCLCDAESSTYTHKHTHKHAHTHTRTHTHTHTYTHIHIHTLACLSHSITQMKKKKKI